MLSFAAVGFHGREWCSRTARCALLVAVVASPVGDVAAQNASGPFSAIAIRTLVTRHEPMLDVVETGDSLIVLGSQSVDVYRRDDALRGVAADASARLTHTRPWPRDLRGMLSVDGPRLEIFLPGVVCRGMLQPLSISCVEENARWPLDLANQGVVPSRNHFITPEGLAFFNAASLAPSGPPQWILADAAGTLSMLDASRRLTGRGARADDVVRLTGGCSAGITLATIEPGPSPDRDDLHLRIGLDFADVDRVTLSGVATALWARSGSAGATVVVRAASGGRYEAHQISVACGR